MREVMGRAAVHIADGMRRIGIPPEPAIARLGFDEARLRDPSCRVDWEPYADFIETLQDLCGGPEGWERSFEAAQPHVFSSFLPALRFLVSPRASYHFVATKMMPFIYSNVRFTARDLPGDRLAVDVEIAPPYRPCAAFFHGCAGGMRAQPLTLGLPAAHVAARLEERRAEFTITPPPSRTIAARLDRASRALVVDSALAEVEATWRDALARIAELEEANARLRVVEAARRAAIEAAPPPTRASIGVSPRDLAARLEALAASWRLTARQVQVVALVAQGLSNKDIAARLGCALHTVEVHVSEALRRSGTTSRAALVAAVLSDGSEREAPRAEGV